LRAPQPAPVSLCFFAADVIERVFSRRELF
jgi:hypothetical protein